MHLVCCCSLPVWIRSFLKKGTTCDLFWPHPGSTPGRIWPKNNNTCKGSWLLHPYLVSSKSITWFWRISRKCEKFTDGWMTKTTDGWCAMTIAHSSVSLAFGSGELKRAHYLLMKSMCTCLKFHDQDFFFSPVEYKSVYGVKISFREHFISSIIRD